MSYIGNQSQTAYSSLVKQDITGNGGSTYTLSHPVSSENDILLYINNVKQEGGVGKAFTATGTTLTLSENISSSDSCYVQYIGLAIQTVVPPDGSVSTAKIANSAVGTAKIADSAVDLTSKVTGVLPYANGGNQTVSMSAYKWGAIDQDNSNTTISSSSIMVNIGNDLASSGVYTCPVDGVYRATIWGMAGGDGANSQSSIFSCYLSLNGTFPSDDQYSIYVNPASTYANFSANFLITCSATNTLNWGLQANRRTLHSAHGQATFKLEHQT